MSESPYGTREVRHTDDFGRTYRVLIPVGAPDEEAEHGLVLGPPDLSALGLPHEIEIRLHNALEGRGVITARDASDNPDEITRAVRAALKVSTQSVQAIYLGD
jgi:hypothetical protein